jgi:hypothetical protein
MRHWPARAGWVQREPDRPPEGRTPPRGDRAQREGGALTNDLSHDPHLRAALRHAPDHALVPPADVSQTILNAARQVHRPARPAATPAPAVRITAAPPRALAWLYQWFASPRLAGGLATGLVAALGLGLWIDLGREPVVERGPEPSPQALRSRDVTPPAPATEPSGAGANTARDAQPAAPSAARPDAPRAKQAERAAESRLERRTEGSASPARERREDSVARAVPELAKSAPPSAAPPAPAAEPALPTAQAAAAPAMRDAQPRDAAAKSDTRMSLAAGRAAAVAGARASAFESGSAADMVAAESPASTLLRRARSERAANSARWSWMPPGSPLMGMFDDAGQAWLARVAQTTRGRWTETTDRAGPGDAVEARWWRDDWPQATLRIEPDGVRWIEHSGRIRYAPLDAATLQRLRSL